MESSSSSTSRNTSSCFHLWIWRWSKYFKAVEQLQFLTRVDFFFWFAVSPLCGLSCLFPVTKMEFSKDCTKSGLGQYTAWMARVPDFFMSVLVSFHLFIATGKSRAFNDRVRSFLFIWKIQGFLWWTSEARDNPHIGKFWQEEQTSTHCCTCMCRTPVCTFKKRPRVYRHHTHMWWPRASSRVGATKHTHTSTPTNSCRLQRPGLSSSRKHWWRLAKKIRELRMFLRPLRGAHLLPGILCHDIAQFEPGEDVGVAVHLTFFGHHHAVVAQQQGCWTQRLWLESVAARVCRKGGARVRTNVFVSDIDFAQHDHADGSPLTPQWCYFWTDGSARPGGSHPRNGEVLAQARRRMERTFPELVGEGRGARLVELVANWRSLVRWNFGFLLSIRLGQGAGFPRRAARRSKSEAHRAVGLRSREVFCFVPFTLHHVVATVWSFRCTRWCEARHSWVLQVHSISVLTWFWLLKIIARTRKKRKHGDVWSGHTCYQRVDKREEKRAKSFVVCGSSLFM